ncbi:hypothetical protein ABII15_28290 [Streptomyces sp. HUAS MG91]|uniref:Uncharacterized protein n=1 Tax=Streptomyces tabacisoli TaxID=3156398 RepID=A0AAU8IZE7_9ACTN
MPSDDGAASEQAAPGVLPVTAVVLAEVPGLTEAARTIGAARGIDYLADREVAAMLHRHRTLLARMNLLGIWGGLLLAPGAVGAWFLIDATGRDALDPVAGPILATPVLLLLAAALYLLSRAFRSRRVWLRTGTRDQVNGYLQVLSVAGVPPRELPVWLKPFNGRKWR